MYEMKKYAIIVAGGSGMRMQSALPKQFIRIAGKPILMHTLQKFYDFSESVKIILVLPKYQLLRWDELCKEYNFSLAYTLTHGGNSRFESVRNGLQLISAEEDSLVAIHDGVRPLVPVEVIAESYETARHKGCAVACISVKDSVREINDTGINQAIDRRKLRLIQTPQTFRSQIIKHSFEIAPHQEFTDDASVAEAAGFQVHLFEGSYQNIKITTPEDLWIAESFFKLQFVSQNPQ
jgi:2-C-methyl-D-erythritol 4-phosphate cytidylyltransferase